MNWLKISWIIAAVTLGCVGTLSADTTTPSASPSWLNRDPTYEQDLKYLAGTDTTLTPVKAIRWLSSWIGHPILQTPTNTEFEPVVNVQDSNVRIIIARISYKF